MPNILRTDAAYAAGWIDAEGCLTTSKRLSGYYPLVQFNTVDLSQVDDFKRQFGGSCWQGKTPKGDPAFYWALSGFNVDGCLSTVYPFLVLKKPQAALIFKLRKINQQMRNIHVRESRFPATQRISDKIRALNQSDNGPVGSPRPDWAEEEKYAYAAGMIDGDGTIYADWLKVDQKRRTVTELLLNTFGGGHNHEPYKNGDSKPLWRWFLTGERFRAFYPKVLPYLKLKSRGELK